MQSRYQQDLESKLESKMEEANETNANLQFKLNRSIKQLETAQKAKENIEENVLRKLSDCNLELEKKFKEIIFDYEVSSCCEYICYIFV